MTRAEWDAKFKIVDGHVERNALALAVALFGDRPPPDPPERLDVTYRTNVYVHSPEEICVSIGGVFECLPLAKSVKLRDWLTEYIDWRIK